MVCMSDPEEDWTQSGHFPYWPGARTLVFLIGGKGVSRKMGKMTSDPNFETKESPNDSETCLNRLGAFENPILGTWIIKIGPILAKIALRRPFEGNIKP